jgi:hypothetical protein
MLREIRSTIQNHLGLPSDDLASQRKGSECNCAFSRQILDRGIFDLPPDRGAFEGHTFLDTSTNQDSQHPHDQLSNEGPPGRFLIVHGKSEVEWAEAEFSTDTAIRECLWRKFGQSFLDAREVRLMSGLHEIEACVWYFYRKGNSLTVIQGTQMGQDACCLHLLDSSPRF